MRFIDVYFDKELIYKSQKGQHLFIFTVKGIWSINGIKFCYFEISLREILYEC